MFVYLDDILVASSSYKEHLKDLQTACQRHTTFGRTIRLDKCLFSVSSIQFIGHQITANGSVPLPSKAKTIEQFPRPQNVRSLQELLGMIILYHRFIPSTTVLCSNG